MRANGLSVSELTVYQYPELVTMQVFRLRGWDGVRYFIFTK
jgi:hypothetical protein